MNKSPINAKMPMKGITMASILIKDTTREQREQIVRESLGDDYDVGYGYESTGINYQLYIDGAAI